MKEKNMKHDEHKSVQTWLFLWRTTRELEAYARGSISAMGLCLSDFGALEALFRKGPLSVSEIGKRILISSGSTTASVDRLEREGLVRREPLASDRRSRIVHLTEAGKNLIEELFNKHQQDMDAVFAELSLDELSAFLPVLQKIRSKARQLNQGPDLHKGLS
ncbi:MAG: MarR family transcriptional regulator [Anaerolineaceae bacterium]|nr:MarR family transcriptional regulator [Anaerolineaceae bacterium]